MKLIRLKQVMECTGLAIPTGVTRAPQYHRAMTWMQRLKRVFNIDIEVCEHCGGQVKVIASIEDPKVIEQILKHLKQKAGTADAAKQHELRPERATPGVFQASCHH